MMSERYLRASNRILRSRCMQKRQYIGNTPKLPKCRVTNRILTVSLTDVHLRKKNK